MKESHLDTGNTSILTGDSEAPFSSIRSHLSATDEPETEVVRERGRGSHGRVSEGLVVGRGRGLVAREGGRPAVPVGRLQLVVANEHEARVERFAAVGADAFLLLPVAGGHQVSDAPGNKQKTVRNRLHQ